MTMHRGTPGRRRLAPGLARACAPLAAAALLAGLAGAPRLAHAQQPISTQQRQEAKRLFNQAWLAYNEREYEEAILKWEQSYDISHEPLIFEAISNAYKQLGDFKRARENLQKYRDAAPKSEWEALDARLADLGQRLADAETATEEAQNAEAERKLREDAEARERRRIEAERAVQDDGEPRRVAGWVLTGIGGAAVIAGLSMDGVAASRRPDGATVCSTTTDLQLCRASARDDIAGSNALALAGDVSWILGAAAVVTGVVLVVTAPPVPSIDAEPEIGLALEVGPAGVGAVARGRF
ncbi:MAG: hypothetical protein HY908_08620 [Myxococcales bacterium]|nr:hypothetical protein [Myxococcales bacterium]